MSTTYQFPFERLEVWNDARKLVAEIYKASEQFPDAERFGLTSQIRRAAVSVASNIAEGEGRLGDKDKLRYLSISWASLMEVLNQLILANDLNMLPDEQLALFRERIAKLSNKINALYNYRKKQL